MIPFPPETATPFEMAVVDFTKGEQKQPAHVRRQPFGRIPALDDNGFEMFDAAAGHERAGRGVPLLTLRRRCGAGCGRPSVTPASEPG